MPSSTNAFDTLVLLGATATGKTRLGVQLADALHGEIISADSRQVYRGLDIGSGKDLDEYILEDRCIPHHLIDCAHPAQEFNAYEFQSQAFRIRSEILARDRLPIVVGGTGLYLSVFLQDHCIPEVPLNPKLREQLARFSHEEQVAHLKNLKGPLHNTTDTQDTDRLIRAIEIEEYIKIHPPQPAPNMTPMILGIKYPRPDLHKRIATRLKQRLDKGMIEEVQGLLESGVTPERLRDLGLEYRFVTEFIQGSIKNRNDLTQKLLPAIKNFAKRQETWFRRIEKNGTKIHWLEKPDLSSALSAIREASSS